MADLAKNTAIPNATPTKPRTVPEAAAGSKKLQAPPGYRILKVRMPDGTIARIKRKIDPATASVDTKQTDAGDRPVKKESNDVSSKTIPTNTPGNGEPQSMSKKSTPAVSVQPIKPTAASAKSSAEVKTTPSSSKSTTTTKTDPSKVRSPHHPSQAERFFTNFAARAASAFLPEFGEIPELGEFHDGDEIMPDDHDDSDGYDDYDGNDDYTGDQSEYHDGFGTQHHRLENNLGMAGAQGLAAGLAPPAYKGKGEKILPRVSEKEVGIIDAKAGEAKPGEVDAMSLHKSYTDWAKYIIWAVMISFPVMFMTLGALTIGLKDKEYGGDYATSLQQAITVSVSTWPIIFAAIVAQSLRTIANYKVERGIQVMNLEQLMGSNSVASSIKQPFLLRRFNLVTIALLLLWSLSPLATQALQRMYYDSEKDTPNGDQVSYLDTWTNNVAFSQYDVNKQRDVLYGDIISRFFTAATLPPGSYQEPYQDQYNFPKIPVIDILEDRVNSESDGWYDAIYATNIADFSSLVGIPLQVPKLDGTDYIEFNISSSYLNFTCSPFSPVQESVIKSIGATPTDNVTDQTYMKIVPQTGTDIGTVHYFRWKSYRYTELQPFNDEIFDYSKCDFTQVFVDSQIRCNGDDYVTQNSSSNNLGPIYSDCAVTKMRLTNTTRSRTPMYDFTGPFVEAANLLIDGYLQDPSKVSPPLPEGTASISQIPIDTFTTRLSLLINTYWQLGYGPTVQDGGLNNATATEFYGYSVKPADAVRTTQKPIYAISPGWISVLFVCSAVMLAAAATSIILDAHTVVPDMLGFAASLARKSRYVDLPPTNTSMSGPERARFLEHQRVMMQDVRPQAPVGRVALGYARKDAKRLEKGRLYR